MNEQKRPNRYDSQQNMVTPGPRMEILPPAKLSEPMAMPELPNATQPIYLEAPELQGTHTGHIRHQDDAITNAKASLLYSKAIILVVSIGVTAIMFLAYLNYGGDLEIYFGVELLALSGAGLLTLLYNRHQGLHHSASGIAHHELRTQEKIAKTHAGVQKYQIDSQERIATYMIDKHAELIERRWELETGQSARQIESKRP